MSPDNQVPEEVRRFIEENIDNVPQVETLLMMSQEEGRDWQVSEIAARNYIAGPRAYEILEVLRRRGLVVRQDEHPGYRYGPATPELRTRVAELARCYQANLSRVAMIIHAKPSASIQEFARAFDLKKDR